MAADFVGGIVQMGFDMSGERWEARAAIRATLAAYCACGEADFAAEGLVVTEASERAGRLRFTMPARPLVVATLGTGVVISCHPARVAWMRKHLAGARRDAIFEAPWITRMARYVARDGQEMAGPNLRYACSRDTFRPARVPDGITVTMVDQAEVAELYRYPGFGNALSYRSDHPRPDMLATVARRDGAVGGIAAASADNDLLWQIGVDVLAAERGRGIGRALVSRLTEAVFDHGRVPYYSTGIANLRSRALAIGVGYWPAWTDLYARDR